MTNKPKRLTAKKVALTLSELAEKAVIMPSLPTHGAYEHAKEIVRDNLIPRWQDDPDGEGWHWVEDLEDPQYITWDISAWQILLNADLEKCEYEELSNRRVCPISERPEGDR